LKEIIDLAYKRIDLHMHSLFSDGELLPSELARRADVLGHETIAITDHVDYSNVENLPELMGAIDDVNSKWDINVVLGAEITHVPAESIGELSIRCRELGAKIVVVHGETLAEPVIEGTNHAAVQSDIDILAHPGLINKEEVILAKENDIALEITARKGHCLANGHVAKIATEIGADLVIDTDCHDPDDLISFKQAYRIALGAGLSDSQAMKALIDNPHKILNRRLR
jgi:histidinol phosphatase-like PHP family hydrolase